MHALLRSSPWFLVMLVVGGCASGPPPGPVVSPTGIVFEEGIPPVETRFSQPATLYIRQEQYDRALEILEEGRAAEPDNPIHHYLAGWAEAMRGDYQAADDAFRLARELYPAYELDIEPRRESAWAEAFNAGIEAYGAGDVEGAIESWEGAVTIFALRSEAHRNLAGVLALEGRLEEAVRVTEEALDGIDRLPVTRVLSEEEVRNREAARIELEDSLVQYLLMSDRYQEAEPLLRRQLERNPGSVTVRSDLAGVLHELGREEEARVLHGELLEDPQVGGTILFNLGVSAFRAGRFEQAVESFRELTNRESFSRDAWFNYANALLAAEAWDEIVEVGDRLVAADPLNETVAVIRARAHLELGDEDQARRYLEELASAPMSLEGLQLSASAGETVVRGELVGNHPDPGPPVRLRFQFYEEGVVVGEQTLVVELPPEGERASLQVVHPGRAGTYNYGVLASEEP